MLSSSATRKLITEMAHLAKNPLEDIRVTFNESDLSDISAVIRGSEGTPYEGGEFVVKFKLNPDYPHSSPQGTFITKIFHPNVSTKGEICVNTLKKDWKETHGIEHVLMTVRCLLIYPNPDSALNAEAGRLLLEHYDDYFARAKLMTSIHAKPSKNNLFGTTAAGASSSSATTDSQTSKGAEGTGEESKENDANITSTGAPPPMKKIRTLPEGLKRKQQIQKKRSLKRL